MHIVTCIACLSYNLHMVIDTLGNLRKYRTLSEGLSSLSELPVEDIPVFRGFLVDKEHTLLFTVERGSITATTSWRESPESRDVTAAVHVPAGSFILYLPGEPFLVKAESEDTEAVLRRLS